MDDWGTGTWIAMAVMMAAMLAVIVGVAWLESNVVTISGRGLNDERLRQAIEDAGYEAA